MLWDLFNLFMTIASTILLIATIISSISPKCDYYVKVFFLYVAYLAASTALIPYGLVVKDAMKTCLMAGKLLHPVNMILGLKWVISGSENIDRSRAYVVVCNHQSALDVQATTMVRLN